jgi:hypothetical protein
LLANADGVRFSREQLHATIKRLNKHTGKYVRFRRDGSGRGVAWEPAR